MGGVGDSGVDVDSRSSPHRAAIEKAQADLRLEYDVCEEKRRELEFLEKGGNPLDFKFGHPTSVSVLAISLTDQHPHQFVTSEAKGNFSLSASLRGDSVESCGRLEVSVAREPNSGDNFDGEIELLENKRKLLKRNRSTSTPSEHSSQLDGSKNAKDLEDVFHFKKGQAYRRRNQSRINRDIESRGAQSSSIDIESCGGHGASIHSRYGVVSWTVNPDTQFEMKFDGAHAMLEDKVGGLANKDLEAEQHTESIRADGDAFGMTSWEPHSVRGREHAVPAGLVCPPLVDAQKIENHGSPGQLNESNNLKGDGKCTPTEGIMSNIAFTTKGLDSESSCTQASFSVEGNTNTYSDVCTNSKNVDCNGAPNGQELEIVETLEMFNNKDDQTFKGKNVTNAVGSGFCASNNCNSIVQVHQGNCLTDKGGEEINKGIWSWKNEAKCSSNFEEGEPDKYTESKLQTKEDAHDDSTPMLESHCPEKLQASRDSSIHELTETELSGPSPAPELRTCCDDHLKVVDKEHEDRILDEARIIEAKRKTIAELSVHSLPTDSPKKSHWHFVLEEMAWLANDFAQERLWGMTVAAQICHSAAFAARLRPDEQSKHGKLKIVAHTLAKAVIEFWHSAEHGMDDDGKISGLEDCKNDAIELRMEEITKCRIGGSDKELNTDSEHGLKCHRKNLMLAVQRYAVRFLQYNASTTPVVNAGVSETYDRASDVNISALPWQDQFAKEKLFYTVPPGAMGIYRKFIESDLVQHEKGNNMQVDADKSMHVAAAAFGSKENVYQEDGEESVYYLPGAVEGSRSLKIVQKKRKNLKSYAVGSYELEGDFAYGQCAENIFNVGSIPAKRMRTASRQRAVGPFNIGAVWGVPAQSRTDASSEDTNSFQDDQNTLQYGSIIPMGSEVESGMDFDKYSTFDPMEFSAISKKKKKPKHQASVCDQRWQVDSLQNEQKDHLKERLDSHQLESNGSNGLFGQRAKKLKIMKQSLDNSFENRNPVSGSIASPVASQMSNMSNPNRLIKLICGRDQGRKAKLPKVSAGQPGSGSPWSLFEDQALVVLVHDLGPNWELVSDAINRTLQFKCIFRKPNECKERHKILMDRTSIDGADNTEDSQFSQPYPSTLPGIPKGSARQLLQRLQGPLEEEIIKSHFEKIILIGQQLHYPRKRT
ncbi:hypothetical protein Nepgr_004336 [Nepenthes gracilis]|uniref:Myb-like domain-containing protein n=1 Tax=Nepenthes gracilis TaxID=150966 RepID=A0AAD3S1B5_NEPGR|nr:hypothetical protein Nepgr_004336 [Nepenthes gracilis]